MRSRNFTASQIVAILKEIEDALPVGEMCCNHGMSAATWFGRKRPYADARVSDVARMRGFEVENARLKRMCADPAQENAAMKVVIEKWQ
jgi:putative transposase